MALNAKKLKGGVDKSKGTENENADKKPTALDLILLYMTPWRNPNSIFVYFILIINILAKVKETSAQ